MNPRIQNTLAIISGILIGGFLNSWIIGLNGTMFPLPDGADISSPDGLAKSIGLFEPIHFGVVFLAHALGTLSAAFIAVRFSSSGKWALALIPGVLFLSGGTYMAFLIESPIWFESIDLIFAYIPMAWLGYKLGSILRKG